MLKFELNVEERKTLAKRMEELTGIHPYYTKAPRYGMDGGECGRGYRPGWQHQADQGEVSGEDRWYRRYDHGTGPLHPKRRTAAGKRL